MHSKIKKYYILNIAPCDAGSGDVGMYVSRLSSLGLHRVKQRENANLIIVNSCVYVEEREKITEEHIKEMALFKAKHKEVKIVLAGCLVGYKGITELKRRFSFVDVFMEPSNIDPLVNFLLKERNLDNPVSQNPEEYFCQDAIQNTQYRCSEYDRSNFYAVPIIYGCSHSCSYCIVPYCRGPARSLPKAQIIQEICKLTERGVSRILLSGSNVDLYGADLKNDGDLADLLKEVAKINGVYQIRFAESHPSYMTNKLLDTVANIDKILPVFVLGLQSGNDEILAKMKRGYTSSKYREVVRRIRLKIPDAFIMTHVIVGFPGESHEQFMETYNFLKEIRPKVIFPHMYSSRPKTLAAKIMTDSVPHAEKKFRMLMLERLFSNYIDQKNRRLKEKRLKK